MKNKEIRELINDLIREKKVRENEELITTYIPEIKCMIGFEHKHPHHNLDVWNHTFSCSKICSEKNSIFGWYKD